MGVIQGTAISVGSRGRFSGGFGETGDVSALSELPDRRTQHHVTQVWGQGIIHGRILTCPRYLTDYVMQHGMKAGTVMPSAWLWDENRDSSLPGYPMLQEGLRQIEAAGGKDILQATFLEVLTGDVSGDYCECKRTANPQKLGIEYDIWGLALTLADSGVPSVGDEMTIAAWSATHGTYFVHDLALNGGTAYRSIVEHEAAANKEPPNETYWGACGIKPRCTEMTLDDEAMPGRILIHSTWYLFKQY